MEPKYYRERAREMLGSRWLFSVLYYFIASLLGSALAGTLICHPEYFAQFLLTEDIMAKLPDYVWIALFLYYEVLGILFTAQLMVGGLVDLGVARFTLNLHDGYPTRILTLLSQSNNFMNACMLFYYRKIRVFLWSLLLIVPGIMAHYRYALSQFIMCDYPDMNAHEAIEYSKELMEGHKMELFKLDLSFIGWYLLCIATCGLGFLVLRPYIISAHGAFYRELCPAELLDE